MLSFCCVNIRIQIETGCPKYKEGLRFAVDSVVSACNNKGRNALLPDTAYAVVRNGSMGYSTGNTTCL